MNRNPIQRITALLSGARSREARPFEILLDADEARRDHEARVRHPQVVVLPAIWLAGLVLLVLVARNLLVAPQFGWAPHIILLALFATYGAIMWLALRRFQHRMGDAVRVARDSMLALGENKRTLEQQSIELERQSAQLDGQSAQLERQSAELERTRQRAEAANHAKSRFLSRASHELRTPMNAVLGFAQLLELESLPAAQREHVEQIVSGGRHLRDLMDDLLDLTRVDSGQLALALEPVRVADVVHDIVTLLSPPAAARDIEFDTRHVCGGGHSVRADRRRLKQVLLNLVTNALKYNERGGAITVSARSIAGTRVRIAVADTGPGLTTGQIEKLFTPFERLGAERTSVEGTGLGLALSRALVTAMGGEIGVVSRPGLGSTFWLELPATDRAKCVERKVARAAVRPATHDGQHGVILYIEDHAPNVELVERILARRPGLTLVTAVDGATGMALAMDRRPDLILLDLNLPDMSGYDVLLGLRNAEATRGTPVVVISADALPERIERLRAAGARSYLTKPYDVSEFLNTIDALMAEVAVAA